MNNRGQQSGVGVFIFLFITIIVGVVLLQTSAQLVGDVVNTIEVVNQSLGSIAVNNTAQFFTNIRALSSVVIFNETGDVEIESGNFTIVNNVIDPVTGGLAVSITPDGEEEFLSIWQVSGTGQPTTFISEGGGRALANLIPLLFALAILIIALAPTMKQRFFDS